MKAVAAVVLLLLRVRVIVSCYGEAQTLFCLDVPTAFIPGFSSLLMVLKDVGEINSTVFHSEDLSSVIRLRIQAAGITAIADGAFRSLQNLSALNLDQNLLSEMNPNWLGRPGFLRELDLAENQVQVLTRSMFTGLSSLTKLHLRKNRIREIHLDTFSSQTSFSDLDLSDNRMTRLSPQVFRSLRLSKVHLYGNPWDCSCGSEDSVGVLKDLLSRSVLVRPLAVTCESPAPLRGTPVWNVSLCSTSAPQPGTHSPPPRHTSVLPTSAVGSLIPSKEISTPSPSSPSEKETSGTEHADSPRTITSHSVSSAASPLMVSDPSDHPRTEPGPAGSAGPAGPAGPASACSASQPSSDWHLVFTLVLVVVLLCLLLGLGIVFMMLQRRKAKMKTVTPGEESEEEENGSTWSSSQSPGHSERKERPADDEAEMGWRRTFTGVRSKSANAVLFTAEVKHRETEDQSGEEKKPSGQPGTEGAREKETQPEDDEENLHSVPYLSIRMNQEENCPEDFSKRSTEGLGQRPAMRRTMARISSWPQTESQRKETFKTKEENQESSRTFTVWTPEFKEQKKKDLNQVESDPDPDPDRNEKENPTPTGEPTKDDPAHISVRNTLSSKQHEEASSFPRPEEQLKTKTNNLDLNRTRALNKEHFLQNKSLKPPGKRTSSSIKQSEERNEGSGAVSRQRPGTKSSSSQAPPAGSSPTDEALLSGNQYAFMDLLHEVVQNNGRWTRERWRQTHKQRR